MLTAQRTRTGLLQAFLPASGHYTSDDKGHRAAPRRSPRLALAAARREHLAVLVAKVKRAMGMAA